jgi:Protein of unknown function (DUF1236)
MKRTLLMTAAAIALMAGVNAGSAQVGGSGGGDQPHMQNSPPGTSKGEEKIKPGVHEREPGAAVQQDLKEKGKMSQGQNEAQPRREGQTGPMDQNGPREKMGQQGQGQIQGQGQMEQKERTTQQGTQQKQNTAGQGSQGSAKSVQLSSEQRTKIHVTLANQRAERITNANFTIQVGARVPRTVRFYPLPVEIVEIVPEYQGYDYVLVGDEILIIDPETLEIVAVFPA